MPTFKEGIQIFITRKSDITSIFLQFTSLHLAQYWTKLSLQNIYNVNV